MLPQLLFAHILLTWISPVIPRSCQIQDTAIDDSLQAHGPEPANSFLVHLTPSEGSFDRFLRIFQVPTFASKIGAVFKHLNGSDGFVAICSLSTITAIALVGLGFFLCFRATTGKCKGKRYENFDSSKPHYSIAKPFVLTLCLSTATYFICVGVFVKQNKDFLIALTTTDKAFRSEYQKLNIYVTESLNDLQCVAYETTTNIGNIMEHTIDAVIENLDEYLKLDDHSTSFLSIATKENSKTSYKPVYELAKSLSGSSETLRRIVGQLRSRNYTRIERIKVAVESLLKIATKRGHLAVVVKTIPLLLNVSFTDFISKSNFLATTGMEATLMETLKTDVHRFDPSFHKIADPVQIASIAIDRHRSNFMNFLATMNPDHFSILKFVKVAEEFFCIYTAVFCFLGLATLMLVVFSVASYRRGMVKLAEAPTWVKFLVNCISITTSIGIAIFSPFYTIYGNAALGAALVTTSDICLNGMTSYNLTLPVGLDAAGVTFSLEGTLKKCEGGASFAQLANLEGAMNLGYYKPPELQHPAHLATARALKEMEKLIFEELDNVDISLRKASAQLAESQKTVDTQIQMVGRTYLQIYKYFKQQTRTEHDFQRLFNTQMLMEKQFAAAKDFVFSTDGMLTTIKTKIKQRFANLGANMNEIPRTAAEQTVLALDAEYKKFSQNVNEDIGKCFPIFKAYTDLTNLICQNITGELLGIWLALVSLLPVSYLIVFLVVKMVHCQTPKKPLGNIPPSRKVETVPDILLAFGDIRLDEPKLQPMKIHSQILGSTQL